MLPMAFKLLRITACLFSVGKKQELQTFGISDSQNVDQKNPTKFLGRISMLSLKRRPFFFGGVGIRGFFESLPWNGQETPPELGEFARRMIRVYKVFFSCRFMLMQHGFFKFLCFRFLVWGFRILFIFPMIYIQVDRCPQ